MDKSTKIFPDIYSTTNKLFDETSNQTLIAPLCHVPSETEKELRRQLAFWLDGVAKTLVALVGVFLNILAAYILNRPKMKNSFNLCLVALNVIDTIFLVGGILESFKRFGMATQLEKVVYPQFLHPLKHITLTASILMIVSLTMERYYAVHSPIKFHQASNDVTLMKRRMFRYVGPVLLLALLLNITKFFEGYVVRNDDGRFIIEISNLRKNSLYSAITKWSRSMFLGVIPLGFILYFNAKVFLKLQQNRRRQPSNKHITNLRAKTQPEQIELSKINASLEEPQSEEIERNFEFNTNQKNATLRCEEHGLCKEPRRGQNNRQKTEDKTAIIFFCITLLFIICHSPRLSLDINELFNLKNTNQCFAANMPHVPLWIFIMMHVSHFCLVLNATLNMVVYGFLCPNFQKELKDVFSRALP